MDMDSMDEGDLVSLDKEGCSYHSKTASKKADCWGRGG